MAAYNSPIDICDGISIEITELIDKSSEGLSEDERKYRAALVVTALLMAAGRIADLYGVKMQHMTVKDQQPIH